MEQIEARCLLPLLDMVLGSICHDSSSQQEDQKKLRALMQEFPKSTFQEEGRESNAPLTNEDINAIVTVAEIYDRAALRYLAKGKLEEYEQAVQKCIGLSKAISKSAVGTSNHHQETQIRLLNLELSRAIQSGLKERHSLENLATKLLAVSRQSQHSQADYFLTLLYNMLLSICYLVMGNNELFYNRSSVLKARILKNFKTKYTAKVEDIFISQVIFLKVLAVRGSRKQLMKLCLTLSMVFDALNLMADKQNLEHLSILLANAQELAKSLPSVVSDCINPLFEILGAKKDQSIDKSGSPPLSPTIKQKSKSQRKILTRKPTMSKVEPPTAEHSAGYSVRIFKSSNFVEPEVSQVKRYVQMSQKTGAKKPQLNLALGAYNLLKSGIMTAEPLGLTADDLEKNSEKTNNIFNKFFADAIGSQRGSSARTRKVVHKSFADPNILIGKKTQEEEWSQATSIKPWRINSARVYSPSVKQVAASKQISVRDQSNENSVKQTQRVVSGHKPTVSMSARIGLQRSAEESSFRDTLREVSTRPETAEMTKRIQLAHSPKPSGLSNLDGVSTIREGKSTIELGHGHKAQLFKRHEVRTYSNAYIHMRTAAEITENEKSVSNSNLHSRKTSAINLQLQKSVTSIYAAAKYTDPKQGQNANHLMSVPRTLIRQNSAEKLDLKSPADDVTNDKQKVRNNRDMLHRRKGFAPHNQDSGKWTHRQTASLGGVYLQDNSAWTSQALKAARYAIKPEQFMIERPPQAPRAQATTSADKKGLDIISDRDAQEEHLAQIGELDSQPVSVKIDSRRDKPTQGDPSVPSQRNFNIARGRSGEYGDSNTNPDRNFFRKDTNLSRASRLITESREELDASPKHNELESDSFQNSHHMPTFGTTALAVTAAIQIGNKRTSKLSVPAAIKSGASSVMADSDRKSSGSRKDQPVFPSDSNPTTSRKERGLTIIKEAEASKKRTLSIKNVLDSHGLAKIRQLALAEAGSNSVPRKSSGFANVAISNFHKAKRDSQQGANGNQNLDADHLNQGNNKQGSGRQRTTSRQLSVVADEAADAKNFKKQISLRNKNPLKSSQRMIPQGSLLDLDDQLSPDLKQFNQFGRMQGKGMNMDHDSEMSLESDPHTTPRLESKQNISSQKMNQGKSGSRMNKSLHKSHQNQSISDEGQQIPTIMEVGADLNSAESPFRSKNQNNRYLTSAQKRISQNVSFNKGIKGSGRVIAHQLSQDIQASLEKSQHVLFRLQSPLHSLDGENSSPMGDKAILASLASELSPRQANQSAFQAKERRRRSKRLELLPQHRACDILQEFFDKSRLKTKRLGYFVLRFARALDFHVDPDQIEFETTSLIGKPFKKEVETVYDSSTNLLPVIRSKSVELPDLRSESGFLPIMFKTEATTFTREYTLKKERSFQKLRVKFISLANHGLNRAGKITKNRPVELQFVANATGGFLKIGLSNHLRINGNRNNGVLAWLNLVNYLRQHVEHLDLDSLAKTHLLFPPKTGVESPYTQKNQIFMKLFLLLVSNRCVLVKNTLGGYQVKFLDPILKYYREDAIESLKQKQLSRSGKKDFLQPYHDKLGMITLARLGEYGPIYRDGMKVLEDGYLIPDKLSRPYGPNPNSQLDADMRMLSLPSDGQSLSKRKQVGLGLDINSSVSANDSDGESGSHHLQAESSRYSDDSPISFQGTPDFVNPAAQQTQEPPRPHRRARRISTIMKRTNGIHKGVFLENENDLRGFSPVQSAIFDNQPFGGSAASRVVPFDELIGLFEDPRTQISRTILARVGDKPLELIHSQDQGPNKARGAKRVSHVTSQPSMMAALEELNYPRLFKFNPLLLSLPFQVKVNRQKTYILLHLYKSPFKVSLEFMSKSNRKLSPKVEASIAYEWVEPYLHNKEKLRAMLLKEFYYRKGAIWRQSHSDTEPTKVIEITSSPIQERSVAVAGDGVKDIQLEYLNEQLSVISPGVLGDRTETVQSPMYREVDANMGVFKIFASAMASLGSNSHTGDPKSPGAGSTATKYIHGMRYKQNPVKIAQKKPRVLPLDDSLFPESIVFTRINISGETVNVALSYNPVDKIICLKMQSPGLKYCIKQIISDRTTIERLRAVMLASNPETMAAAACFDLQQTHTILGSAIKVAPRPQNITPNVRWQEFSRSNGLSNALRKILYQSEVQRDISSLFDVLKYFVSINSSGFGRVSINCSLFYTYRNFDCFLVMDLLPSKFPNIVLKLVLNKADIDVHLSKEVKNRLFDKAFIVKMLNKFAERIVFEKSPAGYSRTKIRYPAAGKYQDKCVFAPLTKYSLYSDGYLERVKANISVVGVYSLRVSGQYCVASVSQHSSFEQFSVEMYFPRTRKRFCFEIYHEELLMMDKSVVQEMYAVSSSEILYLAEKCRFDYRLICQEIVSTKSGFTNLSSQAREVTMQDRRSESIVLKLIRQKKNSNPMSAEEELVLRKANRFLMFYQWEHILKKLEIVFNSSGTPLAKIATFKAPLRETLMKHFHEAEESKHGSYWFEASITHRNMTPARFWASGLTGVTKESLMQSEMMLRVNFISSMVSKNDKLTIWELMQLYPFKKHKMEMQGVLKYQDLFLLGLKVFKDFRKNFSKSSSTSLGEFTLPRLNMISYFSSGGRAIYPQKSNSSFKVVDQQFVLEQFPILLLRKVLTTEPMTLLVVMMSNGETLDFIRYSLSGEQLFKIQKSVASVEEVIPFARNMLAQPGCRFAFGERLFYTFKNSILLNFHRQELVAS